MGFGEIISRLPRILGALKTLAQAAAIEKPDLAIVIDYPDFHFKLARKLKALGVPVIYYIPPKVWAWRRGRIRELRELFARVLCILPFEQAFYQKEKMPVRYVGNPLVDELPLELTRAEARAKLGIETQARVLALLPGSRPAELKRHLEPMLEAAAQGAVRLRKLGVLGAEEKLTVLLPFPATADLEAQRARTEAWQSSDILSIRVSQGDAAVAMVAADAGLVKSGTSTLEAAILGLPHVVIYRSNAFTHFMFKHVIRYRDPVGLVNLILRDQDNRPVQLTREILCEKVTAENLAEATVSLLADRELREKMRQDFQRLRAVVLGGEGTRPSERAADEVLEVFRELRK